MHKHVCSNCGNVSYSATISDNDKCPQCTEKHIIVNEDFMDLLKSYQQGSVKIIVNRRKADRRVANIPVEVERRVSPARRSMDLTPIGWVLTTSASVSA